MPVPLDAPACPQPSSAEQPPPPLSPSHCIPLPEVGTRVSNPSPAPESPSPGCGCPLPWLTLSPFPRGVLPPVMSSPLSPSLGQCSPCACAILLSMPIGPQCPCARRGHLCRSSVSPSLSPSTHDVSSSKPLGSCVPIPHPTASLSLSFSTHSLSPGCHLHPDGARCKVPMGLTVPGPHR